ncbi:MAG: AAA family ATPase [Candidatus Bathyarchaeia archaeon]
MKILSLEVKNIRGIKYIKINPEGKNIVVYGPNGTGKSAIVDAIDFLFTGKISRLTGEGTKLLSLREHGCHVDMKNDPKNTIVLAKIEIDGKEISVWRSINKPSTLKIEPKEHERLVRSHLVMADLGLHILSRREILRYITAEAGKRAKIIMSLLNLMDVEELRSTFVTLRNEADAEYKQSESSLEVSKSNVSNLLSMDSFSEQGALDKVNELRKILGGSEINKLTPEKIKENLSPRPFSATEEYLTKQQIENTIRESRKLMEGKDELLKRESELKATLEEVVKEAKLRQYLLYEKLYETGICLVDEYNICPLCGRQWVEGDFRKYLEDKKKEVEIAKEKQGKINEISSFIKTKVDLLINDIDNIAKAHRQSQLETLDDTEINRYLSKLHYWSEAMIKPLEYFEDKRWPTLSLQDIFETPFFEEKMLVPLEKVLLSMGEKLSKQQNAWDTLTKMEIKWREYQQAAKREKESETLRKRAEALLDYFEKARDSILENIYDAVKSNFDKYYRTIHLDDEEKFTSKISHVGAELNFEVDFYGRGMFPPHALHSEGHQDSMGICLFFALNKYLIKDAIDVIILDDVIMSIDRNHRRSICQLLKQDFPDKQFIITTHDNTWARELKSQGIVQQKNMIHFVNWNIETGPIFELEKDMWDRIKDDLNRDDVSSAAQKLRRNAEYFFENICDCLEAKGLPYRATHQWTLGDFAPAAISSYKEYLKKAKSNSQKMHQTEKFKELNELDKKANDIIVKSQIEQWIINESVHYSRWGDYSKRDFEPVVKAFKDLFDLFTCSSCGSAISVKYGKGGNPEVVSCNCGKIFWNVG